MYCANVVQVTDTSNQPQLVLAVSSVPAVTPSTCSLVVLDSTEASNFFQASVMPDSATAAEFWSFAFLFVLGSWLVAKNAGIILSVIRRF